MMFALLPLVPSMLLDGLRTLLCKPMMERYASSSSSRLAWLDRADAELHSSFWQTLLFLGANDARPLVISCPRMTRQGVARLAEVPLLDRSLARLRLTPLADAPVPSLLARCSKPEGSELVDGDEAPLADAPVPSLLARCSKPDGSELVDGDEEAGQRADAIRRVRAWVRRTLTPGGGLRFCPYTQSDAIAGGGLETQGIRAAPILHDASMAPTILPLLVDFWRAVSEMVARGEAGASSILLAAPAWDGRWAAWCTEVFPVLEASLLASGLSRQLGIVCFHPEYETPSAQYLARHRFGHMHSQDRIRSWVQSERPDLSKATSDETLAWAAAYQRRSPHAVINVLWAAQLEAAEQRRTSSRLYTRNVGVAIAGGREALELAAAAERS